MRLAVYWLYLALWRDALRDFLPNCLNAEMRLPENERSEFLRSKNERSEFRPNGQGGWRFSFQPEGARPVAFVLSALFGMATHLLLDAFTHPTGWFVQHFTLLRQPVLALPLFKWLQYGGPARCGGLPAVCVVCRAAPAIPFAPQCSAEVRFLGGLRGAVAARFCGVAGCCAGAAGACGHAGDPPD
ncbi:DUF4184 family protein [Eikenella sp. Marseille-P7795]|uniref:DUF4184 family protein n=1 Tax=Eikenella sp. Marseille-P7795 TaxID=2866577 RepID=UPI0021047A43|nr:DUF4184 family protein [Eikenella sp. Marseille-P7795]